MTAYNQGLISLYRREIAAEKELKHPNQQLIKTLKNRIKEIQS